MELAEYIDHTLLIPTTSAKDVERLCAEAVEYGFCAVCIPPYFVPVAQQALEGKAVKVATVAGFPLGYSATAAKVEEIKRALEEGAQEVDVVINLAAVKGGDWNFVRNDIDRMTTAVHIKGKVIKIIFETAILNQEEIKRLCGICNELGVDFAKTSTGFASGGATLDAVRLLRGELDPSIRLKASGGIRTAEDAMEFIKAGANRLGTSTGIQIIQGSTKLRQD